MMKNKHIGDVCILLILPMQILLFLSGAVGATESIKSSAWECRVNKQKDMECTNITEECQMSRKGYYKKGKSGDSMYCGTIFLKNQQDYYTFSLGTHDAPLCDVENKPYICGGGSGDRWTSTPR